MLSRPAIVVVLLTLPCPREAHAERPPQPRANADVVLTGAVEAVAETWDFETDHFTVSVRVDGAERGASPGELFAVNCFRWSRPFPGANGASGHRGVPAVGDHIRVFAFRRGFGYEGAYPDWYDVLRPTTRGRYARLWDSRKLRVAVATAASVAVSLGLLAVFVRWSGRRDRRPVPARTAPDAEPGAAADGDS